MNKILLTIITALTLLLTISSCHHDTTDAVCPGPVVANWKVDGTAYQASTALVIKVGTVFTMNMVACNQSPDKQVGFNFIPYPPVAGIYDLKNDEGTGTWNGTVSGIYSVGTGASNTTSYFTDSLVNYGTLTITSVNTSAKTFSAGFSFKAKEHNGTTVVNITDGVLTNVTYP